MTNYLEVHELAEVLGNSPETIRKNMRSNPMAVPPRMHIPGTRMLRWRRADVDAWLDEERLPPNSQGDGKKTECNVTKELFAL
jgi:predicted DNA-binding transcriptional regulator AlpA